MSLCLRSIFLLLAVLWLPGDATAQPEPQEAFVGDLDGLSVNPPNASPATGHAGLVLIGDQLDVSLTFSGLIGTVTASHIHCCTPPPGNAGVAVTFIGFPTGVTSGAYTNQFDLANASSYNSAFITAHGGTVASAEAALLAGMRTGQAYTCVHTAVFPGSEIRAFLVPILLNDGFESGDTLAWSSTVP